MISLSRFLSGLGFICLVFFTGCAMPQADQGTSSGWTDVSYPNITVNFYCQGKPSDSEAVEGDLVPAGRVVLDESPITINFSVGSEGESKAERGDSNANSSPNIETELPLTR